MYLPFPCSDTSWALRDLIFSSQSIVFSLYSIVVVGMTGPPQSTNWIGRVLQSMESKGNVDKHHKDSEIDSFVTWHIKKRHKLGYGRIVVVMLVDIFMLSLFWPFSYPLMQFFKTFHPASTRAITRIENWAFLPTQGLQFSYTLIRAFSKISAYTKTVQFHSTKNTSMNKFLAQGSSSCLILGGTPPASLSEGKTAICWNLFHLICHTHGVINI